MPNGYTVGTEVVLELIGGKVAGLAVDVLDRGIKGIRVAFKAGREVKNIDITPDQVRQIIAQLDKLRPGVKHNAEDAVKYLKKNLDEQLKAGGKAGASCGGAPKPEARLPKKGTPERAAIENARNQGIRAKKAEELANIKAGGTGSGVWTEKELKDIRRTGEFPDDVRWHHDPTVANRPDLAADPRVVRPIRGGTPGHLDAHGGNWRN